MNEELFLPDAEVNADPSQALAFGLGCDARLEGRPLVTANPYHGEEARLLRQAFASGWLDVHRHWGRFARRAVRPLPPVRQTA